MKILARWRATTAIPMILCEKRNWTISQLKRALSGHAYARGALFGLRSEGIICNEKSNELFQRLELILANIHELSAKAWGSET